MNLSVSRKKRLPILKRLSGDAGLQNLSKLRAIERVLLTVDLGLR
jgi:hypothetical protein